MQLFFFLLRMNTKFKENINVCQFEKKERKIDNKQIDKLFNSFCMKSPRHLK